MQNARPYQPARAGRSGFQDLLLAAATTPATVGTGARAEVAAALGTVTARTVFAGAEVAAFTVPLIATTLLDRTLPTRPEITVALIAPTGTVFAGAKAPTLAVAPAGTLTARTSTVVTALVATSGALATVFTGTEAAAFPVALIATTGTLLPTVAVESALPALIATTALLTGGAVFTGRTTTLIASRSLLSALTLTQFAHLAAQATDFLGLFFEHGLNPGQG